MGAFTDAILKSFYTFHTAACENRGEILQKGKLSRNSVKSTILIVQ